MAIMNPADKRTWVSALRSGKYKQAVGALRKVQLKYKGPLDTVGTVETAYCCLGVLQCELSGRQPKENHGMLRPGRFGLTKRIQSALAAANDPTDRHSVRKAFQNAGFNTIPERTSRYVRKSTFAQIADWIEKNL